MKRIVSFSGGVGSWYTARRVVDEHGPDDVVLLFADTMMEDEDLYRFLGEAAANIGAPLITIKDGRTPWQVFHDSRYIGNSRIDPCSRVLKRELLRKWLDDNCDPAETIVCLGIDWTEMHRFERAKPLWEPYTLEAPLCEPPYVDRDEVFAELARHGIRRPRLYEMGFVHNNCGGFCIKAGHASFKRLLQKLPERYAYHEGQEEAMRSHLGKDVSILRDRTGGTVKPLTLRSFRERLENDPTFQVDPFDEGGCACFTPDEYRVERQSTGVVADSDR